MSIKTSKIKEVVNIKPHTNNYGTTYYHNLQMENGDKINLGKKKEQQVGWELTYEIIEEGQQEFNKAKAVAPEGFKSNGTPGSFNTPKVDWADKDISIIRQSSLKASIEYLKGAEPSLEEIFETAEEIINWVNKRPVQKAMHDVASSPKGFKKNNDNLPF
jgi:hypothetical protein|tara:strand:- start:635 stop:1114 length:480 start_codon:yes stop_codon:yes gene_type:complete